MKFSQRKKSKLRKVRFDRNKKEWRNFYCRTVDGERVIDKMSIGQTLYLLTEGEFSYSIFRVGANGELTKLSPKRILKSNGAFQKQSKWFRSTKVTIDSEGQIVGVEKPIQKAFEGIIIVPLF